MNHPHKDEGLEELFKQYIKTSVVRKLNDEKNWYVKIYGLDELKIALLTWRDAHIQQQCLRARIDELEKALSKSNTAWVIRGEAQSHEDFVHANLLRDRLAQLDGKDQ